MAFSTFDIIGAIGAVLTTACWLPQARKVLREQQTKAISLPFTLMMITGILCWLVYGLALMNWPLIASNAISFTLLSIILALKLRHG
jgi:MtN3 and saliva related transmembrane protein